MTRPAQTVLRLMDYDKYFEEFEAAAKTSGDVATSDAYYWHGSSDFVDFLKEKQNLDDITWTCFHCGFSTRNEQFAAAHFGERDEPALCRSWAQLNADGRVHEYQSVVAQLDAERSANAILQSKIEGLEYQVDGRHAEIVSFKPFRECQSIQDIFNVYDSIEGRALAAEERSRRSLLQEWVMCLPLMQQTVLLTATRAPDGLRKMHPVKVLCRWLRRCYLVSAFDKRVLSSPYEPGGGSFMGPCQTDEVRSKEHAADLYIGCGDEIPLHFHFHLQQAAEIMGYKHPDAFTRLWWLGFYQRMCAFGHSNPETEAQLDLRLSDNKEAWQAREA